MRLRSFDTSRPPDGGAESNPFGCPCRIAVAFPRPRSAPVPGRSNVSNPKKVRVIPDHPSPQSLAFPWLASCHPVPLCPRVFALNSFAFPFSASCRPPVPSQKQLNKSCFLPVKLLWPVRVGRTWSAPVKPLKIRMPHLKKMCFLSKLLVKSNLNLFLSLPSFACVSAQNSPAPFNNDIFDRIMRRFWREPANNPDLKFDHWIFSEFWILKFEVSPLVHLTYLKCSIYAAA